MHPNGLDALEPYSMGMGGFRPLELTRVMRGLSFFS